MFEIPPSKLAQYSPTNENWWLHWESLENQRPITGASL